MTLFTRPSIARQKIKLGTLRIPEYTNKCQIITRMRWTEEMYKTQNSLYFLEAELGVYLEAEARARSQQKPPGGLPGAPPKRRRR